MRPFYETDAHRDVERAMVAQLAEHWRCRAVALPRAYPVDYALANVSRTRAFVECKDRARYDWDALERGGGVFLSAHKWATARALAEATRLPVVLLVRTREGLWYHRPDDWSHDGVLVDGGRTDRGDWQDTEPCVLLRQARFAAVEPERAPLPEPPAVVEVPPARIPVSPPSEQELRWS